MALAFQCKEDASVTIVGAVTASCSSNEAEGRQSALLPHPPAAWFAAVGDSLQQEQRQLHRDTVHVLAAALGTAVSGTPFYDLDLKMLLSSSSPH